MYVDPNGRAFLLKNIMEILYRRLWFQVYVWSSNIFSYSKPF